MLQQLLMLLLPTIAAWISAEWAKGWNAVGGLGPVAGPAVGSIIAGLLAFVFSWLAAHVPALAAFLPPDVHTLSTDGALGILTALVNALFHVAPAQKARRLSMGGKF